MASKVPKFGAWEGGENFTVFFDNARKIRSNGTMINPNDPEQNPNMFPQKNGAPAQAAPSHKRGESQGKQSKVPQFGAWDNEGNVGYTVCFENARKTKNEPQNTENEPQHNRDMLPHNDPPTQTHPATIQPDPQEPRAKVPNFGAWEGGGDFAYTACFDNIRKTKNGSTSSEEPSSGTQLNENVTPQNEPLVQEGGAKVPQFGAWDGRENVAYTAFFDNARKNRVGPIEPQLNRDVGERARPISGATNARSNEHMGQGGVRVRAEQSSTREGHVKNASRGSVASMAGSETNHRHGRSVPGGQATAHSRGKPQSKSNSRGNQNPEKGATIPPFGVWHNDPSKAEDFTGTFRRAVEERKTPLNKDTPASYHQQTQQSKQERKKGSCFPCFR